VFVLAGKGIDHTHAPLAGLLNQLGVTESFRLLGEVREVEKLYPAFDLLVLSSAWGEAFPNVLGEAMACGVPCVSTEVGDCAEVVKGSGITVPPRDPQALAGAIGKVLSMPLSERTHLGEIGRQRVLDRYSLEAVAQDYLRLYTT
jgi:glycosyltransferase involved in cell wall biosynthesis